MSKINEKGKTKAQEKNAKKDEKRKEETKKAVQEEKKLQQDHPLCTKSIRLVGDGMQCVDEIAIITGVQKDDKGHVEYVRWWIPSKNCNGKARLDQIAMQAGKKYAVPFNRESYNFNRLRDWERAEICSGQNDLKLFKVMSSN